MGNITEENSEQLVKPKRAWLKWAFKLSLLGLIFYYLTHNKSLKASDLHNLLHSWNWTLTAFLLMWPSILVCAWRYKLLLRILGFEMKYRQVLSLNMIGTFFDMVAPLSNGGDLAKVVYLSRIHGKKRFPMLLLSALIDRVLGLFALFMFALLVCLIARAQILQNPELRNLARILTVICLGSLLAFFVFVSKKMEESPLRRRLMHILPFHQHFENVYAGFAGLRQHLGLLAFMLLLSMINHLFACCCILSLAQAVNFTPTVPGVSPELPEIPALVILPLAMFLNTFGFAGGFGAGELAFEELFKFTLKLKGGAQLALNYHIVQLLPKLFGFPFVWLHRHDKDKEN